LIIIEGERRALVVLNCVWGNIQACLRVSYEFFSMRELEGLLGHRVGFSVFSCFLSVGSFGSILGFE